MKRLVTLLAGLTLFIPVVHGEVAFVNDLNAALGSTEKASPPDLHITVPHALAPLVHALGR